MIRYEIKRTHCVDDEKKELISYIEYLVGLNARFEKLGILLFEEMMNDNEDTLERISIWLVMQGYNPSLCVDILSNLLSISAESGLEYVKHILLFETLLLLHNGYTRESELRLYLLSFVDAHTLYEYIKRLDESARC